MGGCVLKWPLHVGGERGWGGVKWTLRGHVLARGICCYEQDLLSCFVLFGKTVVKEDSWLSNKLDGSNPASSSTVDRHSTLNCSQQDEEVLYMAAW